MQFIDGEVHMGISDEGPDPKLEPIEGTMHFNKGGARFRIQETNQSVGFRVNTKVFYISGNPKCGDFGQLQVVEEAIMVCYRGDSELPFSSQSSFVLFQNKVPTEGVLEIEWPGVLSLNLRNVNDPD